MAQAKSEIEEQ